MRDTDERLGTEMLAEDFAQRYGVTLDWRATGYQRDETGWEHHAYVLTLTNGAGTELEIPWRQGMAVDDEPTLERVLPCIASELSYADESDTFEDFADNFGYDSDSLSAFRTFEALKAQRTRVYDWCTSEQMFEDFASITEDGE